MDFLSKKQKIILGAITIVMLVFIGYYILKKTDSTNYIELETISEDSIVEDNKEEIIDEEIIIHITGEVENEGIIKIKKDARIADVIDEAGGVTNEADLSKINLAYSVKDGQKIYIPNVNDKENEEEYITQEAGDEVIVEGEVKTSKVNINTAKQTELETLSGIGPSIALKIINYREENGEFKTIEDIKNVPGIGDAKFENIKENICVK